MPSRAISTISSSTGQGRHPGNGDRTSNKAASRVIRRPTVKHPASGEGKCYLNSIHMVQVQSRYSLALTSKKNDKKCRLLRVCIYFGRFPDFQITGILDFQNIRVVRQAVRGPLARNSYNCAPRALNLTPFLMITSWPFSKVLTALALSNTLSTAWLPPSSTDWSFHFASLLPSTLRE